MPSFIPDGIFYPSLCHYPTIRRSCAPPIQPSNLSTAGCEPSVFSSHSRRLRGLSPALLTHPLKNQALSWAGSSKLRFRPIAHSLKIRTPPWKISANRRLRAAAGAARCGGSAAKPAARPALPPAFALRQKDAGRPFSVSPASLRLGLFTCSSPDRPPQRRLRSHPPWGCCPYR